MNAKTVVSYALEHGLVGSKVSLRIQTAKGEGHVPVLLLGFMSDHGSTMAVLRDTDPQAAWIFLEHFSKIVELDPTWRE